MARKKRSSGDAVLGSWIDTYADMVTLLLCFFVLLYSSSTLDETKWQYIYQSFNTSGTYVNPFVTEKEPDENATSGDGNANTPPHTDNGSSNGDEEDGLPQDFTKLFAYFQSTITEENLVQHVSIKETPTRIFIRFNNAILFDGDSAELKSEGKSAISALLPGIKAVNKYIKSIEVSGHTANAVSLVNDWDLSVARASAVVRYMDYNTASHIDSGLYTPMGRAYYDPIADNATADGRAANRRVELTITRRDVDLNSSAIMDDIMKYDYNIDSKKIDPFAEPGDTDPNGENPDDKVVSDILDNLESKYDNDTESDSTADYVGPVYENSYGNIPEDILKAEVVETAPE